MLFKVTGTYIDPSNAMERNREREREGKRKGERERKGESVLRNKVVFAWHWVFLPNLNNQKEYFFLVLFDQ